MIFPTSTNDPKVEEVGLYEDQVSLFLKKKNFRIRLKKKTTISDEPTNTQTSFKEGKWDKEEHALFLTACHQHGNNWAKVRIFYFIFKIKRLDSTRIKNKISCTDSFSCTKIHY
jgi:hypothetical protein